MSRLTLSVSAVLNFSFVVTIGLIALFPAVAGALIVPANVVNVDFNTTSTAQNAPSANATFTPSGTYSGLASGPVTAGTSWNGLVLGDKDARAAKVIHSFSSGALTASDGTTLTAVTVSLSNITQYDTAPFSLSDPNVLKLLDDYAFADTGDTGSFTLSGLDGGPATYDLYLYSENGNFSSATTTFTIGATAQTVTNNSISPTIKNTLSSANTTNYTVFTGLHADALQQITGTFTQSGANGTFNGFQLVETFVPEPASMALLAGGSLLLLRRRR